MEGNGAPAAVSRHQKLAQAAVSASKVGKNISLMLRVANELKQTVELLQMQHQRALNAALDNFAKQRKPYDKLQKRLTNLKKIKGANKARQASDIRRLETRLAPLEATVHEAQTLVDTCKQQRLNSEAQSTEANLLRALKPVFCHEASSATQEFNSLADMVKECEQDKNCSREEINAIKHGKHVLCSLHQILSTIPPHTRHIQPNCCSCPNAKGDEGDTINHKVPGKEQEKEEEERVDETNKSLEEEEGEVKEEGQPPLPASCPEGVQGEVSFGPIWIGAADAAAELEAKVADCQASQETDDANCDNCNPTLGCQGSPATTLATPIAVPAGNEVVCAYEEIMCPPMPLRPSEGLPVLALSRHQKLAQAAESAAKIDEHISLVRRQVYETKVTVELLQKQCQRGLDTALDKFEKEKKPYMKLQKRATNLKMTKGANKARQASDMRRLETRLAPLKAAVHEAQVVVDNCKKLNSAAQSYQAILLRGIEAKFLQAVVTGAGAFKALASMVEECEQADHLSGGEIIAIVYSKQVLRGLAQQILPIIGPSLSASQPNGCSCNHAKPEDNINDSESEKEEEEERKEEQPPLSATSRGTEGVQEEVSFAATWLGADAPAELEVADGPNSEEMGVTHDCCKPTLGCQEAPVTTAATPIPVPAGAQVMCAFEEQQSIMPSPAEVPAAAALPVLNCELSCNSISSSVGDEEPGLTAEWSEQIMFPMEDLAPAGATSASPRVLADKDFDQDMPAVSTTPCVSAAHDVISHGQASISISSSAADVLQLQQQLEAASAALACAHSRAHDLQQQLDAAKEEVHTLNVTSQAYSMQLECQLGSRRQQAEVLQQEVSALRHQLQGQEAQLQQQEAQMTELQCENVELRAELDKHQEMLRLSNKAFNEVVGHATYDRELLVRQVADLQRKLQCSEVGSDAELSEATESLTASCTDDQSPIDCNSSHKTSVSGVTTSEESVDADDSCSCDWGGEEPTDLDLMDVDLYSSAPEAQAAFGAGPSLIGLHRLPAGMPAVNMGSVLEEEGRPILQQQEVLDFASALQQQPVVACLVLLMHQAGLGFVTPLVLDTAIAAMQIAAQEHAGTEDRNAAVANKMCELKQHLANVGYLGAAADATAAGEASSCSYECIFDGAFEVAESTLWVAAAVHGLGGPALHPRQMQQLLSSVEGLLCDYKYRDTASLASRVKELEL